MTELPLVVERTADRLVVELEHGEHWWGGAVPDGGVMPFDATTRLARDLATNAGFLDDPGAGANQSAPLLLSDHGRVVGSASPFAFAFDAGTLTVTGRSVTLARCGSTLREAFLGASATWFPPSGSTPALELVSGPQYNTWIELPFVPTQAGVLAYVRRLLDAGFPPGVVMIDDRWSEDYGEWTFHTGRFPDPAAMIATLHGWGCPVMLWLVPFVSPDSATFRDLAARGLLVGDAATGRAAVRPWWNGWSGVLDLTHPDAVAWLRERLADLQALGVDGFKLDAGDLRECHPDDVLHVPGATPTDRCAAWAGLAAHYPFNELRACWQHGGAPLAQRLHDKPPTWGADGLASLVPELIAQGLIGHPYTCPDMIGGGDLSVMDRVDAEQLVRYAQVAALAPMMQFSVSPARVLDETHLAAVHAALAVRAALLPTILDLVRSAAVTGEPVVRPLAYHGGPAHVRDEFLLGPDVLVAPVLERGATSRTIVLPPGRWRADDGSVHEGGLTVPVVLTTLPVLHRV